MRGCGRMRVALVRAPLKLRSAPKPPLFIMYETWYYWTGFESETLNLNLNQHLLGRHRPVVRIRRQKI